MEETIKAAIRERIGLGYTKEDITNELTGAGYSPEEAERLYEEYTDETASKPFDPDQMPTVVQEDIVSDPEDDEVPLDPVPPATPHSRFSKMTVASFAVGALLIGAGAVYGFTALFFSSAPYDTESAMVKGMLMHTSKLTAHGFNLSYHGAVEARNDSTLVFDPNSLPEEERADFAEGLDAMVMFGVLPAEVDARLDVGGVVDLRDRDRPEFDISANLHLLAEPFIINTAGSLRMADGVLYGKIDDIPANFEAFTGGIPTGQWILLADESDMELPSDVPFPISSPQVLNVIPPEVKELFAAEAKRLISLPLQYAQESRSYLSAQAAQVGMPLLEVIEGEEEQRMLERSMELMVKYPPFTFTEEPKKVELNSEVVYQYDVDVDFDNLRSYLLEMSKEAEAITGETLPLDQVEGAEFFDMNKELFAELNRLTNMAFAFREDGSFAGVTFDTVFTFDHPDIKQQFRLEMSMTTTRQNDAMDITAPSDLYPKTLEEIIDEQARSLFSGSVAPVVPLVPLGGDISGLGSQMLGEFRFDAELWYNQNGYSYEGMCTQSEDIVTNLEAVSGGVMDIVVGSASDATKVVCNTDDRSYAISFPLPGNIDADVWCVDWTGYSGEGSLDSAYDTSCE